MPGNDVFALYKLFIPVNISNKHWTLVVVHLEDKKIEYYDSMGGDGSKYVNAVHQYLSDEFNDKKKGAMPGKRNKITQMDGPRQQNNDDCGVFTCVSALWLSRGRNLDFNQDFITRAREYIAISILEGKLYDKLI